MLRLLIRNRLDAQLGISRFKYGTDPKKKRNQILMCVVFTIVALLALGYVTGYAYVLQMIGLGETIPMFGYVISFLICFVFTAIKTNGELFAFKDYDMLSSLPMKTTTIIGSRVLILYIWNTAFTLLVMIPMMIIYGIFMAPGILYYVLLIPGILLTALLPTVFAVVVGAVLTAIASKFRYYQVVQSALVILLMVFIFGSSFAMGNNPGNVFEEDGNVNTAVIVTMILQLKNMIMQYLPSAKWFQLGVVEGDVGALGIFLLVSLLCYLLFLWILAKFYRQINTAITTYHAESNYHVTHLEQKSLLSALYKKEWKRYVGCSIYFTNTAVGCILGLVFAAGMMIFGIERMAQVMNVRQYSDYMISAIPWIIWMFIFMANTTCCSLSLEGKNMWILDSLPIPKKVIYDSKILVNLTVTIPTSFLAAVFLCIALKPNFLLGVMYFLTPMILCICSAVWGIFVNQRSTHLDWESETKVVKQDVTTMIGMMPGMLLAIVLGFVNCILPVNDILYLFGIMIAFGLLALLIYQKSMNKKWKVR